MMSARQFWPLLLLLAAPLSARATPADSAGMPALTGGWARDDGAARIIITPCGANLCAVNTWVEDPNGREKIGDELVLTLQPAAGGRLKGDAYDVRRKLTFTMTITLSGAAMHTSGCVFLGLICKSAGWTRIN